MLHKFSVVDDSSNATLIGTFLDDTQGPPSQSILNHLICRNEYEKNLPLVTSLSFFGLVAYSKEKDYRRVSDFVSYLQGRKKAAKVQLDKVGTVGYLFPGPSPTTPGGVPCLRCHYQPNHPLPTTDNKKRAAPTSPAARTIDPNSAHDTGMAPTSPPAESTAKRGRTSVPRAKFTYLPPDPLPVSTTSPTTSQESDENAVTPSLGGEESSSHTCPPSPPPALPDPSQFPRSRDPRFAYAPPTPVEGQVVPPFYDDPGSCPVVRGLEPPEEADVSRGGSSGYPTSAKANDTGKDAGVLGRRAAAPSTEPGNSGWGKDQRVAEGFYNQLRREKGARNQSLVFHLRKLNNWVKSQLINGLRPATSETGQGQGRRELEVLDLACGKGGDFTKWREVSRRFPVARYVGVDIAKTSLIDAIGRYHQDRHIRAALGATLTLACADLGSMDLVEDELEVWEATEDAWSRRPLLDEGDLFDAVTMQFALHYMFEDEGRARFFLKTVARHLRVGGTFIATTVDARVVVEMMAGSGRREEGGEWVARLVDEEKRELCRLQVDDATYWQLFRPSPGMQEGSEEQSKDEQVGGDSPFCGLRYKFLLKDGSEEDGAADAVNAPEWMIPLPLLEAAAGEYGLRLEQAQNFHELVEEHRAQADGKRGGIHWLNYQGSISPIEWEIARIYIALKFTRVQ